MSLDYPNRNDWLAIRHTPRKAVAGRVVWNSGTYAPGNNKRKAKLRAEAAERRAIAVKHRANS